MTSAHRKAANGASFTAFDGLIVAVYVVNNVHKARFYGRFGCFRTDTGHESWLIHALRPLSRGRLTVGIAVRHHHDHRLGFACCNQIVHDLGRTSKLAPRVFVASCTVKEVEYGVSLALIVARRRVNCHATLHF